MSEVELFTKAIEMTQPSERLGFLDRECAGKPELRARLDQLLEVHPKTNPWLDSADHHGAHTRHSPIEAQGTLIAGRYKLLEQIGEGGMGSVWMADQIEPVKRRVAVKLLRTERGSSKTILARFDAERQAIALMDHPNIAKLLDAGAWSPASSAGGSETPFFVMELVKGIPLNQYCDIHQLSIPDRLQLFLQICSAVQHAHQKGVIHRDLKPTNILVEAHDGKPVPKVIDFGLAKATRGMHLTENTLFTGFGTVMGTPLYMSPEQAMFNATDVDTRADIYALGVVLYELLTGTTPLTKETIRKAALDEVMKFIREQEAPTPSSRLSSHVIKPSVSANRQTEPATLGRYIQGELDWIVMKAISKDRDRRYQTANGFAQDIERFLQHEPVTACPPTTWYRLKKFVQRHQGQVLAAGLVLLALLAGVIGTTLGWLEANRQTALALAHEETAKAEKSKAETAAAAEKAAKEQALKRLTQIEKGNKLLEAVFDDLDIRQVREDTEPLEAVLAKRLAKAGRQLEGESIGDPLMVASLQNQLGLTLINLGFAQESIPLLQKARELRLAKLGANNPDTIASINNLALSYKAAGLNDLALPLNEETLKWRKANLGADHHDTLVSMNNLAACYKAAGRNELALPLYEATLKARREKQGADHPDTITSMNNLAASYQTAGKEQLALPLFKEALQRNQARLGAEHPSTLLSMNNLALSYRYTGRNDLALPMHQEALKLQKIRLGAEHSRTLLSMSNLAESYQIAGRNDLALPLFEETLKIRKRKLGIDHPDTLLSMGKLAGSYQEAEKYDLALPLLEEALQRTAAKQGADHPATLLSMNKLASGYRANGQLDKALPLYQETLRRRKAKLGADHPDTLSSMNNLASAYWSVNQLDQSIPLLEEVLTQRVEKLGRQHPDTLKTIANLGVNYRDAGRLKEAVPLLEEAYAASKKHPAALGFVGSQLLNTLIQAGEKSKAFNLSKELLTTARSSMPKESSQLAVELSFVGNRLLELQQYVDAESVLREALVIREKVEPDLWSTFNTKSMLGEALFGQKRYLEAEPLLIQGYQGMIAREKLIPVKSDWLQAAIDRLIQFYTETNKPDEVKKYQVKRVKHPNSTKGESR